MERLIPFETPELYGNFLALNKHIDVEVVNKLQSALDTIINSGEIEKLHNKYK